MYIANVVGFFVGITINVTLIRKYVFRENKFSYKNDIALSIFANGATLGIGMMILWALVELIQINPYIAKIATNGITFMINYFVRLIFFRAP